MIRYAKRWTGEGFVGIPEGGVAVVQYTITTCVDGDLLKVFWSYCSEVGFIKVPRMYGGKQALLITCRLHPVLVAASCCVAVFQSNPTFVEKPEMSVSPIQLDRV